MKYHAKWKQSNHFWQQVFGRQIGWTLAIFIQSIKAYQSLEATVNSKNDIVNFNAESENDVNNRFLETTNLKATDCPSIYTDNQVEAENNPQSFLDKIWSQQGELSVICGPST